MADAQKIYEQANAQKVAEIFAAAEARATLEKAVRDDAISSASSTYSRNGWYCEVRCAGCQPWQSSYLSTEAEALAAAAAHVESLRKPALPDVEGMMDEDVIKELKELGCYIGAYYDMPAWLFSDGSLAYALSMTTGDTWARNSVRALHAARARAAQQ